jgi:hypothetical protein
VAVAEKLYREFKRQYGRSRCLGYMLWALCEHCAEAGLPPDLSRAPRGLAGWANRIAARVRTDFDRFAPRWAGNNVRGGWRESGLSGYAHRLTSISSQELAWLLASIRRWVIFSEPPLWAQVPFIEDNRAFLLALLDLPSQGSLQQGVIYAVASRYYRLMGARVSSRHPFCADKNAGRSGDLHVERCGKLWLCLEISCSSFSRERICRTLNRLPEGARALFLSPRPIQSHLPHSEQERAAQWRLSDYLRLMLDHLSSNEVEKSLTCLEREYLVGLAGGRDYGRYLEFAHAWPKLALAAG